MKHLSWIVTLPLAVIVIVFSVNNIEATSIDLWPFGIVALLPTYLVVLLSILFGFFIGAAAMWVSDGGWRREARRQRADARRLSRELESLRKSSQAKGSSAPPAPHRLPADAGS